MKFLYRILVDCLERYRDTHLAKKTKNLTEKTPRERDWHSKADRQRGKTDVTKLYKHIQTYLCRDEEKDILPTPWIYLISSVNRDHIGLSPNQELN